MRTLVFSPMLHPKLTPLLLTLIFITFFTAGNIIGDSGYTENPDRNNEIAQQLKSESFKHIVLTWQDDPENSQAVTWRTDVKLDPAIAEIAISFPSPDFDKSAKRYRADYLAWH